MCCFVRAPLRYLCMQRAIKLSGARSGHLPINGGMLRSSERVLSEDATPALCARCGTCAP
jgi:hypothetical protein